MIFFLISLIFFLLASLIVNFIAIKRLLQFDDLFDSTIEILFQYQKDLVGMVSGDIEGKLFENEEVQRFIRRNNLALRDLKGIVDRIGKKERQAPPLPDTTW